MQFEFATATRIVFGAGTLSQVGCIAQGVGHRALIAGGRTRSRAATLEAALFAEGLETYYCPVVGEPTVADAVAGARLVRENGCDLVIGFGGGSAIDAAKAIAALATNPGDPVDYLEVVGKGLPLQQRPLPCIAVPTTAGAGAEVTRNAVLASPEHRVKVSMRHPWMLPAVALVDPVLTHSLSPAATVATGLDAFTQLLEAFVCRQANPMTDAFCREGLTRAAGALRRVYRDGNDAEARESMALAALLGGLALANAKLGAVHGFAGVIGGMFPAPHGAVCAALLPGVMAANLCALRTRAPESTALARYEEVARIVTGQPSAQPEDGLEWILSLCEDLSVPALSAYGVTKDDFERIAAQSAKSSSMQGNPVALGPAELVGILARS